MSRLQSPPEPAERSLRRAFVRLDRRVTLAVASLHAPKRDRLLRRISFLGSPRFLIPATFAAAGALLFGRRGILAAFLGGAVLGARGLSPLVKWIFRRRRPDLWPALETENSHSFPSTHAATATAFFGAAAVIVFHWTGNPVARSAALILCVTLAAAVAFSRVYLGAHWLSDVVAGVLIGLLWLAVWAAATPRLFRDSGARGRESSTLASPSSVSRHLPRLPSS
ncbi:MAG: phosphatase PAP2 family protein [Acidobacteriota bacterium]|nr:phosphatase PAP2 family protein [Acidobacteriota bacterium]MDQ2980171.1 phosphatase PAP2 family protein [Acidobacteriota bacterium]